MEFGKIFAGFLVIGFVLATDLFGFVFDDIIGIPVGVMLIIDGLTGVNPKKY